MVRFLLALALAFSATAFAKGLPLERLEVAAGKAKIQGVHYLNADGSANTGKWVIFSHGLGSNFHEFEYLVPLFMAAGYDCYAFNYRGHGNDRERSQVDKYADGDYRLEKMAGEDFPAMVEEVQRRRGGGKGIVVGHSMGGMNPRGAFALGKVSAEQIESIVLLGSPPHFDTIKAQKSSQDFFGILSCFETYLNNGRGDIDVPISFAQSHMESILDVVGMFNVGYWVIKGVIKSLIKGEMRRAFGDADVDLTHGWIGRAMSANIPKDILRSFSDYSNGTYPFKDVKVPVPVLHITGAEDVLVKHDDVATHTPFQSEDAGYWLAKIDGVGHLGLVTPRAIESYKATLFEFLEREGDLGASHRSYEFSSLACSRRLIARRSTSGRKSSVPN